MTSDHRSTAILLAVLTIPFGIAIYQDATASENPAASERGYGAVDFDESDDYDYEYEEALEALEAEPARMSAEFFDEVLFDGGKATAPVLAGPLAGLRTGSTLTNLPEYYEHWRYDGIAGHERAYLSTYSQYQFNISFPDNGAALEAMTAQWGQPTRVDDDSEASFFWVNAEAHLRAQLTASDDFDVADLTLERFLTLEEFVAPRAELFGFEDSDMFALSAEELSEIEGFSEGEASISLPALLDVDTSVSLDIFTEDGRVKTMESDFSLEPEDTARFLALLKTKMGAPKKSGDEWNTVYTFTGRKRIVEVTADGSWLSLLIQPR